MGLRSLELGPAEPQPKISFLFFISSLCQAFRHSNGLVHSRSVLADDGRGKPCLSHMGKALFAVSFFLAHKEGILKLHRFLGSRGSDKT
jgi:hypothetical protein